MTTHCLTLPNDRTEAEVRAQRAGWHFHELGWWTRDLRPGDYRITDAQTGVLITPRSASRGITPGPYVLSAELALAYDRVSTGRAR